MNDFLITEICINNYKCFANENAPIILRPDKNIERLEDNHQNGALKVVGIFGVNNTGKSTIIEAISIIRKVLNGENVLKDIEANYFADSKEVNLSIDFIYKNKYFSYEFTFDTTLDKRGDIKGFVDEGLYEYPNGINEEDPGEGKLTLYRRNAKENIFIFKDDENTERMLEGISGYNTVPYLVNADYFPVLLEYRKMFTELAESIDIIDGKRLSTDRTIKKILEGDETTPYIIKEINPDIVDIKIESSFGKKIILCTHRNGDKKAEVYAHEESEGTYNIICLAGYIADALENGRKLIIDNFGDSIYSTLSRALILVFNVSCNRSNAQLIFTSNDALLIDCDLLLREDQVYFTGKWFNKDDTSMTAFYCLSACGVGEDELYECEGRKLTTNFLKGRYTNPPEYDLISLPVFDNKS